MRLRVLSAVFAALLAPGCVMVQVGVSNPIPGLSTVAVAPFINLSAERSVDGRRFALAYATELQKVPGFEVLPVGVTEVAMVDTHTDLNDVDEVLRLAKYLRVDAIVIGAVTDYSPYYPPRVGMQVNWYSPRPWAFYPGIQTDPAARCQLQEWDAKRLQEWRDQQKKIEEQNAPETPVWERMYHSFQHLPLIRAFYEPTLVWRSPDEKFVWRAQSPSPETASPGTQPSSQAIPTEVPSALAPEADPQRPQDSGGTDDGHLVRVAHYQEMDGMPPVIRLTSQGNSTDAAAMQPPPPLTPNPGAVPAPLPDSEQPAPLPPDAGPPVPGKPGPPPSQPGIHIQLFPDTPPDSTEFDQVPKGMEIIPRRPEGPALGPAPVVEEPPRMQPILGPGPQCPPQPNPYNVPKPIQPWQLDPRLPLMAYTRMFDGADAELVAALRDYVELSGDLRSGGWVEYLHRSDDFIRFTSYRMIMEMLSLHGGEGKHRLVFKFRKYR